MPTARRKPSPRAAIADDPEGTTIARVRGNDERGRYRSDHESALASGARPRPARVNPVRIDGSNGEGGGQVLRTALGMSLATGQAVHIDAIRGQRKNPGLQRQDLACVEAAQAIGDADVGGGLLGSTALEFAPKRIRTGEHRFVGGVASTVLMLQTVLPGLLRAPAPTRLVLQGGTHNPMAPPFEFAAQSFAPVVERMGAGLALQLVRHGFWPLGGGSIAATVTPTAALRPLELMRREPTGLWRARALVSRLPEHIGRRQLAELVSRFGYPRLHMEQTQVERIDAECAGNVVLLELPMRSHCEILVGHGERGMRAEQVAGIVATEALALLAADVPVGPHLADQLLVPMALAGGGRFRTVEPSLHLTTAASVIERFVPARFHLQQDAPGAGAWTCTVAS